MSDAPAFSRAANPQRTTVEVRPLVPVEVVAVIDGWCSAVGVDRTTAVNQWLRERAIEELRKASLIVNATRGNPPLSDQPGSES